MKIYLINENYDNCESYEERFNSDDVIGAFDNYDDAQNAIDLRIKANIEEFSADGSHCEEVFHINDFNRFPKQDFGGYLCKEDGELVGRAFVCEDSYSVELYQYYITEQELNTMFSNS